MGSLGFWEIVALGVLALLIFGPDRLPGIAKQIGSTVARFRQEANKTLSELREAADVDDDVATLAREAREIATNLKDVRRSARDSLIGGVAAVNTAGRPDKPHSDGGPTDLAALEQQHPTGHAPFDPDAT